MKPNKIFLSAITAIVVISGVALAGLGPNNPNPPSKATLAWNASAGATGYKLYQGAQSGNYTNVVETSALQATISMRQGYGFTNYFAVTATNAAGLESGFSTEAIYVSASIPAPPSGTPTVISTQ